MPALRQALALALPLLLGSVAGATQADASPSRATCSHVADATTLIPDGAKAIVHIDGKKTFRSALYRELRSALDRDLQLKDGLAVLDACGLGLEDVQAITAGVSTNDETVVVVEARGVGSAKTLACLHDRLAARDGGKSPWTIRREGCKRVLTKDGEDFGFALDDTTLVLTQAGWADQVRGLIDGRGKSAAGSGSAGSLAVVDRSKATWFTMKLSDSDRSGFQGSAATDLESIAGAMDFVRGVDVVARLQLADPGAAQQMCDELAMYRDMIEGVGALPKGMAGRLEVTAKGRDVDVSVALSASDLEQLRRALEPHTQGKNPL